MKRDRGGDSRFSTTTWAVDEETKSLFNYYSLFTRPKPSKCVCMRVCVEIYKEKCNQQWKFGKRCFRVALEGAGRGTFSVTVTAEQTLESDRVMSTDFPFQPSGGRDRIIMSGYLGFHGQTLFKKKKGKCPCIPSREVLLPAIRHSSTPRLSWECWLLVAEAASSPLTFTHHDYVSFSKQEKWMESQATS